MPYRAQLSISIASLEILPAVRMTKKNKKPIETKAFAIKALSSNAKQDKELNQKP